MRSYFHSATKKAWSHLKALWQTHPKPFTGTQAVAQHLVVDTKLKLLTMPIVTLTPTQTLAAITLSQVECRTRAQSWLVPTTSHLMRWRCFILTESQKVWTENRHRATRAFLLHVMVVVKNSVKYRSLEEPLLVSNLFYWLFGKFPLFLLLFSFGYRSIFLMPIYWKDKKCLFKSKVTADNRLPTMIEQFRC